MSEAENDTIRLQGLALGYPGRTLFENVDLSFGRGELTALIGRNGTGKSTLLRTIMGLLRPLRGGSGWSSPPDCRSDSGTLG